MSDLLKRIADYFTNEYQGDISFHKKIWSNCSIMLEH